MKRVIVATTELSQNAGELLFNIFYNFCRDEAGISTSFSQPLSREQYYLEFDKRFEDDVESILVNLLGKTFDISMHEIDIINEAILEKASTDSYFAYKKHDQYDKLIDEWELPVLGE